MCVKGLPVRKVLTALCYGAGGNKRGDMAEMVGATGEDKGRPQPHYMINTCL